VMLINELSHIGDSEFAETLADNATKMPHGVMIVATNSGFLDSWQYDWRTEAETQDRWNFHTFEQPAPWLNPADIAEAERRNSTSRFNRLWRGMWVAGGGDALDAADIDSAIKATYLPWHCGIEGYGILFSLDVGIKRDRSALVGIAIDYFAHRIQCIYAKSWKPMPGGSVDLQAVQDEVEHVANVFHTQILYDPHQAQLLAQQLAFKGVRMIEMPFTGRNCDAMASATLQTFRERKIDLFPDPELIAGLRSLEIVERPFGYKLQAPKSKMHGHADKAIALCMLLPDASEALPFHPYDGERVAGHIG